MPATLTGDKRLDRKLKELSEKTARKVSAAGIRAALRVIANGIKSEIPPHMKDARKAIGMRFKRNTRKGDGIVTAKVGGGVGKKTKKKTTSKRSKRRGVGISSANIHWLLMGTGERTQKTTGRSTGVMPAVGAVPRGFAKSKAAAFQKIKENIRKGIAREAAK